MERLHSRFPIEQTQILQGTAFAGLLLVLGVLLTVLPLIQVLAVVVSLSLVVLFVSRPLVGLLVFFAIRAGLDNLWSLNGIGELNFLQLFSGLAAMMAGGLALLRLRSLQKERIFGLVILYGILLVFGALRPAKGTFVSVYLLSQFLSPFLLCLLVADLMNTHQRQRLFFGLIILGTSVPLGVSFFHLLMGTGRIELHGYNRLLGSYSNLHNHALMLGLMVSLGILWFSLATKRWEHLLSLVYLGVASVCLYYTYVRTAWLGVTLFTVAFLLLNRQRNTLLFLGVLLLFLGFTSSTVQDRFGDFNDLLFLEPVQGTRDNLGSGRWYLWKQAIDYMLRQPLSAWVMGLGLGGHYLSTRRGIDPHCDYLTLFIQMGPLAVILYLWIAGTVMRKAHQLQAITKSEWSRTFGRYIVALMPMVLFCNLVSNGYVTRITPSWYAWGLFGLMFALYKNETSPKALSLVNPSPTRTRVSGR